MIEPAEQPFAVGHGQVDSLEYRPPLPAVGAIMLHVELHTDKPEQALCDAGDIGPQLKVFIARLEL